ncbi:MAG: hypothetical protein ACI883_001728, partial [Candidatus Azotimanducaceae bacterium]
MFSISKGRAELNWSVYAEVFQDLFDHCGGLRSIGL